MLDNTGVQLLFVADNAMRPQWNVFHVLYYFQGAGIIFSQDTIFCVSDSFLLTICMHEVSGVVSTLRNGKEVGIEIKLEMVN